MKKRLHVHFHGRVQGIGFRFTCERIAERLGVLGWVRNLGDGSVELVAEAEEEILQEFLGEIKNYFSRYIRDATVDWLEASGEYENFGIKF